MQNLRFSANLEGDNCEVIVLNYKMIAYFPIPTVSNTWLRTFGQTLI